MLPFKYSVKRHELRFLRPATTSRGAYKYRLLWLVRLEDASSSGCYGIGEAAPLPGLSPELNVYTVNEYEALLCRALEETALSGRFQRANYINEPSICFAIESALAMLHQPADLYASPFALGQVPIPINGLVWMSSIDRMTKELEQKVAAGFRCIKCKIGALDFDREWAWLRAIRDRFPPSEIELRLDANGAFSPEDALDRLDQLASLSVHSVEQPIRAGQWQKMSELIAHSPVPIALDEELIGYNAAATQIDLLETLKPHYIVLKPTLHGGLSGLRSWVDKAQVYGIHSWVTSALESNVGLEMIARLASSVYHIDSTHPSIPQGLGTGSLYGSNFPSSLKLVGQQMWITQQEG